MIEENGIYYDRCTDCGAAVKERKTSELRSVCDECWERRDWMVRHIGVAATDSRFGKIQRAMASHTGTAKKQILALQREYGE